jgi:hypothetical protein
MDSYVQVSNDVSLAVKAILQVKKAYLVQMRNVNQLLKQNQLLNRKACALEKSNKELRALSFLSKQNRDLHKEVTELKCDNKKHKDVLKGLLIQIPDDTLAVGNPTGSNRLKDLACPSSPPSSSTQNKRKSTPIKKSAPNKRHKKSVSDKSRRRSSRHR